MWRPAVAGAGDGKAESRRKEEEGKRGRGRVWLGRTAATIKVRAGLVLVSAQSARGHARTSQRGA